MNFGRCQFWQTILVTLLIVVVAACSAPGVPQEVDGSLFDDDDISGATLELSLTIEDIFGSDLGELADGGESDLLASLDGELSSQAVLAGSGGHIAYISHVPTNTNPWEVWLANQSTDRKTRVYVGTRQIQSVAISADGDSLILAMQRTATSSDYEVYRLTVSTRSLARLTYTNTPESNVSMSADGQTLVWEGRNASGNQAVFVREHSGSTFTQSILSTSVNQLDPSLSSNGRYIVMVRPVTGAYHVMRYDRTNNSYRTVLKRVNVLRHPSISDDGNTLATLVKLSSSDRVLITDIAANATRLLMSRSGGIEHPHLTADGNFLSYGILQNSSWNIFTVNLASGQTAQAVASTSPVNNFAPYWQQNISTRQPTQPGNQPPTVSISSPANNATFTTRDSITFTGTASDPEDGTLSSSIAWSSSIGGPLGTGASVTTSLPEGTHTITASVTDSQGLRATTQITITVTVPANQPPTVSIASPANNATFTTRDSITFTGTVSDPEDGDLSSSISWSSNLTGSLGVGARITASLAEGTHIITASVTDSQGLSAGAQTTITVTLPPNQPPTVSITSPANNATFTTRDSITFAGSASDPEDGNLNATISWSSSIDGFLDKRRTFSRSLAEGTHIITASVTDSQGLSATAQITVTVTVPPRGVWLRGETWLFNGQVTNRGTAAEGLLLNSRMVNATFDDANPETAVYSRYPDGSPYDPDRQTREFIAQVPTYASYGLNAISLNFQGGGTRGDDLVDNTAFNADGSLKQAYLDRMDRAIRALDNNGMVALVGFFYFHQDQRLMNEAAVLRAVDNATDWLVNQGYTNVIVEINNEADIRYDHAVLRPARVHELIARVQRRSQGKLLVSTSFSGGRIPTQAVLDQSNFILLHGNDQTPTRIRSMVSNTRSKLATPKPIVFNEDSTIIDNFNAGVSVGASWGYFDWSGFQRTPTNWRINTTAKRTFFERVKELTGR